MIQTLEEAAIKYREEQFKNGEYSINIKDIERRCEIDFCAGAKWNGEQSQWISVKDRLPTESQRVLAGILYYCKYSDREPEYPQWITPFTYKDGKWVDDAEIVYLGKSACKDDIEVICWMPIPSLDEILKERRKTLK